MINSWKLIAEANGIEIGEEFLFKPKELIGNVKCKILDDEFIFYDEKDNKWHNWDYDLLADFLSGKGELEKLPFEPVIDEEYWTIDFFKENGEISEPLAHSTIWWDYKEDYSNKMLGIVFRTKEEANKHIPIFLEKLKEVGW